MASFEKHRESNALAELSRRVRSKATAAQPPIAEPAARPDAHAHESRLGDSVEPAVELKSLRMSKKVKRKRKSAAVAPETLVADDAQPAVIAAGDDAQMVEAPEAYTAPPQSANPADSLNFSDVYLNTFTTAFGDELATFRSSDTGRGAVRTELLLQCIEAGMDAFSQIERALCLEDVRRQRAQAL